VAKRKKKKAKVKKVKEAPLVQKQRADIYTMMLIVAFLMLVLGSVLMYQELERYKWDLGADKYRASAAPTMQVDSTIIHPSRLV